MKNNKGFTFIEVLAAVTILGIITVIAITGVSRIIEKTHKEYYKNQEENLVLAAQSYMNNNKSRLPKLVGKKEKITAKELIQSNYLKKSITEYDGKTSCDEDESYVNVFKYDINKYSYTAVVSCTNYSTKEAVGSDAAPAIDINFSDDSEDLKNAKVDINILGDKNSGTILLSYSYSLQAIIKSGNTTKYVEIYDTGNREAGRVYKLNKTIDVSKYTLTGKPVGLQVRVTATNINGVSKTVYESKGYQDNTKPKCVIAAADQPDTPTGVKEWVNTSRTITVGCDDGNGSECTKKNYTKTFTRDNYKDYITIYDNAGNSEKCYVTTYIDKTAPTLTIKVYKAGTDDKKTGSALVSKTVNNTTKSVTIESKDFANNVNTWLNKANYPNGVIIEIDSTDNVALYKIELKENAKKLKLSDSKYNIASIAAFGQTFAKAFTSPGIVPIKNNKIASTSSTSSSSNSNTEIPTYHLKAEGARYAVLTAKDGFENTVTVTLKINIDRTPPSVPSITMNKWSNNDTKPDTLDKGEALSTSFTDNTWSKLKVFTYPHGSVDEISEGVYYQYTTTGATTNNADHTATYRNVEAQGISYIKWRSVDKAGNPSEYTGNKTLKLDWTPPTVTVTAYKCGSDDKKSGSSVGSATSGTLNSSSLTDNHSDWLNKDKYPNGVCFEVTATDGYCLKDKSWSWNKTGYTKNASGYTTLDGGTPSTASYSTEGTSGFKTTETYAHYLKGEGHRYGTFTFTDGSGNSKSVNVSMLIDRTPPTKPTVNGYKRKNSNTVSDVTGLSSYTFDTWYKGYIVTKGLGSTDSMSGFEGYYVTTIGQGDSDINDSKQVHRNVGVTEGTVTVKYRAKDVAGNASGYTEKIVKLDRKAPTDPTVNGYKKKNSNNLDCNDSTSGLSSYTSDTWYSGYVYTKASGSTDGGSGGVSYYLTTTGQSNNANNANQSCRNVSIQGKVTNKYVSCDTLGNCNDGTTIIVKLDRCESTSTDWGSWGSCSASCGSGTKYRSGTKYSTVSGHTSHSCGSVSDSKSCYVDCPPPPSSSSGGDTGGSSSSSSSSSGSCASSNHSGVTCGCFLAGTKVYVEDGKTIDIDKLKVGQKVLSYNSETKKNEYNKVAYVFVLDNLDEELYTLSFDDKTALKITSKHRVLVKRNGKAKYLRTEQLRVGDKVYYKDGNKHVIEKIAKEKLTETVYNIEVEGAHNFYVGDNGILVHNVKRSLRINTQMNK